MRRVLASAVTVALLIGVVEFAVGAVLWIGGALPALLGATERQMEAERLAPALIALLFMWTITGSAFGVLARMMPPMGLYTRFVVWGIASKLMLLVVWAGGLALGLSILSLVACQVAAQFVYTFFLFRDLREVCGHVYPFWKPADLRFGLKNLGKSLVLTATSILTQLQQNGLNLLVTVTSGAAILPVFTTARTLANVFMQGTAVISDPLAPDIIRYHVKNEPDKLMGAWAGIWFVGGLVINAGLVVTLLMIRPFYSMWTRGAIELEWSIYLPLVAAVAIKAFAVPLLTYLNGLNHLRGIATVAAVQTALVLGIAILLSPALGLSGFTFAILAAEVVATIVLTIFVRQILRDSKIPFPRRRILLALAPPLTSCAAFALAGFSPLSHPIIVAGALAVLAVSAFVMWRQLPTAVRSRILGLLSCKRK